MKITAENRFKSRLNSTAMLLLLLITAALLAWLSNRYPLQFDLTRSDRHTLSKASRDLLDQMPDPIQVTSYARENPALRDAIRKFIQRYQNHKNTIQLNFVNPDAAPDETRELGISVDGELVIHYQQRKQHVPTNNEQDFTNALLRLTGKQDHWLAFIEGHGERDPLGRANFDLHEWTKQLQGRGFKVQPINLVNTAAIPDNTSILVIAGPRTDYLAGELDAVIRHIDAGGNLLWLADPGGLHGLDGLAELLGIDFHPGTIVDSAGALIGIDEPTITLVTKSLYQPHAVTRAFKLTTLFPHATGLKINDRSDWRASPILSTGDHAWSETGELKGEIGFDQATDVSGPLTLGVAMERQLEQPRNRELITLQQRIIVIGDGDFLSNTYLGNGGNLELGIRLINWLGGDDDFITITPKTAEDLQINLSTTALGIIGLGFLFLLPLALLAIGITISIRRKTL